MNDILVAISPLKNNPKNAGIFSDLDGTLSKIAPTPSEATVTQEMRELLKIVNKKYGVLGIVSGRDSGDTKKIVGLDDIIYVGNHGLEWIEKDEQYYAPEALNYFEIAEALANELNEILRDGFNFIVEKKRLGIAVHYRRAKNTDEARSYIEGIIEPLAKQYMLKITKGRYVIELRPDLPVNKGDAVIVIAHQFNLKNLLYLGDDITDVDVFKALKFLREEKGFYTVSVAVVSGESSPSVAGEADHTIESVDEVEEILRWLTKN